MYSKYFQLLSFSIITSSVIIFGCTSDESYDNSGFVSEVNTALPDTDTDTDTDIPFVVVGNAGAIYTSSDGVSWDNRSILNESQNFNAVTYGNGIFVAVALKGRIYYSTDTITWSKTGIGDDSEVINDVVYGNGIFIGVGINGTIIRSTDGKTWIPISYSQVGTNNLKGIAYGADYFLTHHGSEDYLSINGLVWSYVAHSAISVKDIIYLNGNFIILRDTSNCIYSSVSGSSWTTSSTGAPGSLNTIAYGNGKYVALSTSNDIWYTSDITSSFTQLSGASKIASDGKITYRNNIFLSVGTSNVTNEDGGSNTYATIQTSSDGINWTIVFRPAVTGLTFYNVY